MTEARQAQEDKLPSYLQLMGGDLGEVYRTTMCQNSSGLSEEKGKAACLFSLYLCCISLVRMFSKEVDSPAFSISIIWPLQRAYICKLSFTQWNKQKWITKNILECCREEPKGLWDVRIGSQTASLPLILPLVSTNLTLAEPPFLHQQNTAVETL